MRRHRRRENIGIIELIEHAVNLVDSMATKSGSALKLCMGSFLIFLVNFSIVPSPQLQICYCRFEMFQNIMGISLQWQWLHVEVLISRDEI